MVVQRLLSFLAASLLFMATGLPVSQDCDHKLSNPCAAANNGPGCSERVTLLTNGDEVST
jgi:hypothetical protein